MKTEAMLDYGISVSRAFFTYYYYIYIILLVLVLVTLSVVGGLVFQIVESPPEAKIIDAIMRQRDSTIRQLRVKIQSGENKGEVTLFIQLYEGQYIGAIRNGTVILNGKQDPLWTFEGSVYYCITTFSLVGYGNLAPRTNLGRAIAIIYCGFTIPVNSLILAELGEMLLLMFEYFWMKVNPRKSIQQKPASAANSAVMNMNNANKNVCTNYQVAIRCRRQDAAEDNCENSKRTCPRFHRANIAGNTDQDAPNLICCSLSHKGPGFIRGASTRSDSEDALNDCAWNDTEDTVDDFARNGPIGVLDNSPMNAVQNVLLGSVMNSSAETLDIRQGDASIDVGEDALGDFVMNISAEMLDFNQGDVPEYALDDSVMNSSEEALDFRRGDVPADALGGSISVDTDDVLGGSCINDPVYALLDSTMKDPDYSLDCCYKNDLAAALFDCAVDDTEHIFSDFCMNEHICYLCDSCMSNHICSLCDSCMDERDNFLSDFPMNGPDNGLYEFAMNELGETMDASDTKAHDDAPSESAILASEDAILASEDAILASEDAILASEGAILASEDAILASEDAILASEGAILASEDAILASEDAILASEDDQGDSAVNNNVKLPDLNKFILCKPPNKFSRCKTENRAKCHVRGEILNRYICNNFSTHAFHFLAKHFSSYDQKVTKILLTSCNCSDISSRLAITDSDWKFSACQHDNVGNSDMHGSAVISVNNSHHHGATGNISRGSAAESQYASFIHVTYSFQVLERMGNEDESCDIPAPPEDETMNRWNNAGLKLQVHICVGISSLMAGWKSPHIHHTTASDRACLGEMNAIATDALNYLSCSRQDNVQLHTAVVFTQDTLLCIVSGQGSLQVQKGQVLNRLCGVPGQVNREAKEGLNLISLFNVCDQISGQAKKAMFLAHYKPRNDATDKYTLLASVPRHLLGQHLAVSHTFDYRNKYLCRICPVILFPNRSSPKRVQFRAVCFPNSTLLLPDSVLLLPDSVLLLPDSVLLLPDSVLLLPDSVLVPSLCRHAQIPMDTIFETVSISHRCFPDIHMHYVHNIVHSRALSRGYRASLTDTFIQTQPNNECTNVSMKEIPLMQTSQPVHGQSRCDTNKSAHCQTSPVLSSRICTNIQQVTVADKTATSKRDPGVFSQVKSVIKLVLEREVTVPDPVAMFWLATPLRCMYIGKRVGNGIRRLVTNAGAEHLHSNGSSLSKRVGSGVASVHARKLTDRNNNVHSDDSDEDDGVEEFDEKKAEEVSITSEPVLLTIATTFIFISLGSTFLTKFAENMTYFDSYWFIWISVATIGYGDIVPTDQRLFLGILAYLFIGLCLMSNLISETSLFFSANVSKTRAITSDAVAIINTRKQLILIQRRAERANNHWAILREKVMKKKIPHHLVEETMHYKAGLMAEEREMVRFAYRIYFKQAKKPQIITEPPPVLTSVPDNIVVKDLPFEPTQPVAPPPPPSKLSVFQRIKQATIRGYRRVKNKIKRTPKASSGQTAPKNAESAPLKPDIPAPGQEIALPHQEMPPLDTEIPPEGEEMSPAEDRQDRG